MVKFEVKIEKTKHPKPKPAPDKLGFGQYFTDHMFVMDYEPSKGWHDPRIVPWGPLQMEPSCTVLHYAQAVFEGLKAYRTPQGKVLLFRPERNMERLKKSHERMCIPVIDPGFGVEAIKTLVRLEQGWIPNLKGTSLYIRPLTIATENHIGAKCSSSYKFMIILSPVGAYYDEGLDPVRIYVETNYVRAVKGGTGYAKTAGNYAASLKAQVEAQEKGFTQVLWLDGVERKYIEEVGTMNVFFKIEGQVITPSLEGSILPGITRESTMTLLRSWGIRVIERRISMDELWEAHSKGLLEEAFGTGTAAVISPIGELHWKGKSMIINKGVIGKVSSRLYDTLTGIQYGEIPDSFGWTVEV